MHGFRIVTAVGERRAGRIVGAEGAYFIVNAPSDAGAIPHPSAKRPGLLGALGQIGDRDVGESAEPCVFPSFWPERE
jgi:hypothetical protein